MQMDGRFQCPCGGSLWRNEMVDGSEVWSCQTCDGMFEVLKAEIVVLTDPRGYDELIRGKISTQLGPNAFAKTLMQERKPCKDCEKLITEAESARNMGRCESCEASHDNDLSNAFDPSMREPDDDEPLEVEDKRQRGGTA